MPTPGRSNPPPSTPSTPKTSPCSHQITHLLKLKQIDAALHLLRQLDHPVFPNTTSRRRTGNLNMTSRSLFPQRHNDQEMYEMRMFEPLNSPELDLSQFPSIGTYENPLNPFLNVPPGSPLDPSSDTFSAKKWLTNLVGFIMKEQERYSYRTSPLGVCFSNLDVHGFGLPTDYQKTVGNVFLELGRFFRCWGGSGKQKVQILKGFDGVLESGEMLLVLGRPGSGQYIPPYIQIQRAMIIQKLKMRRLFYFTQNHIWRYSRLLRPRELEPQLPRHFSKPNAIPLSRRGDIHGRG